MSPIYLIPRDCQTIPVIVASLTIGGATSWDSFSIARLHRQNTTEEAVPVAFKTVNSTSKIQHGSPPNRVALTGLALPSTHICNLTTTAP